ncbi:MAG: aldehyde ferredoxin oxidoreductase C-terminal domain-containing protein, partial [Candidatus Lindowbacteria bacterium]|nr:aldehyde ferredoxin oxidoreductase C-terminal domain-containing protein [Candidatus Lindowbacteria bacterium]
NAESLRCTRLVKRYSARSGCFSCSIGCRHRYTVPSGPYAGMEAEGPDYGTLGAFGPICGITAADEIFILNDLVNRLGLDSVTTGNLIAWVIELSQKGMLADKSIQERIEWGDTSTIRRIVEDISARKNIGDILALGPRLASREMDEDSSRLLWWTKNLVQSDSVDVRSFRGFALSIATATRGADHLRSRPTLEALHLPDDLLDRIYGGKVSGDPLSYSGKARMVWWTESLYAVADALGICKFVLKFNNPFLLGFEELAELLYLGAGLSLTPQELFRVGQRITSIEREILGKLGVSRNDDMLPDRYFQAITEGPLKGTQLDRTEFGKMLDEYYGLHGWEL